MFDASQADPDGLATTAREQLHRKQEAERAAAENREKASGLREQLPALAEAQQKATSEQHARVQQAGQGAGQRSARPHWKALARLRKSRRGEIVALVAQSDRGSLVHGLTVMVALTLLVLTSTLGTRDTGQPTTAQPARTPTTRMRCTRWR